MCSILKVVYKVLGVVSNGFERKYIKKVLVSLDLDDEAEVALEYIEKLRTMYEKKLQPLVEKYGADVDDYLTKKLKDLGIDIDELFNIKDKKISKQGLVKIETLFKSLEKTALIAYLKDEKLMSDMKTVSTQLKDVEERFNVRSTDINKAVEKYLRENVIELEDVKVAMIKEQAVTEYKKQMNASLLKGKIVTSKKNKIVK